MPWTPPSWDNPPTLILASQSPRRKALLQQIGLDIATLTADICERSQTGESARELVQRLAQEKAKAGAGRLSQSIQAAGLPSHLRERWRSMAILGADTLVVDEGEILPKPQDRLQGEAYLRRLSGRTHNVITGVSVTNVHSFHASVDSVQASTSFLWSYLGETEVTFKPLREEWILNYWDTGEPQDKAGGYAIQGLGSVFVDAIHGSYTNVVGLPVEAVGNWLASTGVTLWQNGVNERHASAEGNSSLP